MGADAEIYVFDHLKYVGEIVPRLKRILLTGQLDARSAELRQRFTDEHWSFSGGVDIDRDCTHLRPSDLAFQSKPNLAVEHSAEWEERACRSLECPSRQQCPFHIERSELAYDMTELVEFLVTDNCLGVSQFVGRSVNVAYYQSIFDDLSIDESHRARVLMDRLGSRGRVVGYTFANSDGIHGWLSPEETAELLSNLENIDLPKYEPTFEAMESFKGQYSGRYGGLYYVPPSGYSFADLSLSFVRTIARIATLGHLGVLWGNDLHFPR